MKPYLVLVILFTSLASCHRDRASSSSNATLDIRMLKVYQSSSYADIDFNLTNNSDKFIGYWEIGIDLFDAGGNYLAHGFANGANLRPHHSFTRSFSFRGVDAMEIDHWKLYLQQARAEEPGGKSADVTGSFTLNEIQN